MRPHKTNKPPFTGERVRLGDVITPAKVKRCGKGTYPVYSMTMHDGIVRQSDRFKKAIASKDTSAYKVVLPGQLVVGFPIDEGVIYVQGFDEPGIMSPAYNVWDIAQHKVLPQYLELALHSPHSMAYYAEKMRGTTARRRSITPDNLRALEITLPEPAVQAETVEVFSSVRDAISNASCQLALLDDLVKSRFVEMFGDGRGQNRQTLKECCSLIQGGKTPSMKHPEYYGGGIPFIKSGDVKSDAVSSGALSLSEAAINKASVKLVPRGSVLVVTRSALLQRKMSTAISANDLAINQDIKAFTPTGAYLPCYLLWVVRSHEQELLAGVRSVSTSALDFDQLCNLPVEIAPLDLQRSFADFVAEVDKSRFVVQQQIKRFQTLYDSLAQDYFAV